MAGISPFMWMLFAWGAVTAVFVILMIYRSLVSMREDDQLFLNPVQSAMEAEQIEVRHKISRLAPYTKGFGWTSAGLAVVIAGLWIYQALVRFNAP
jgi:hypothetical protein